MKPEFILKQKTLRGLFQILINNRTIRQKVMGLINARAYEMLVEINPENRPRRVQEDKHHYLMALLSGFDRGIERGLISKNVRKRMLDVFISNVVLNNEQDEIAQTLGFCPPMFLVIAPTGKCNLRCIGCYAASDPGSHASLDSATFNRLLTEKEKLWGSYFTVITGGEPFLWRDGKQGFLDVIAAHPTNTFLVYTNSTFITDDVARRMAELGNITPAISVEGFEKETDARRGKGMHKRILTAFGNLRRHGVPFGISATPNKNNWDIITGDKFIDFYFEREGALYGWLFQYMAIGRGQSIDLMVPPRHRVTMLHRMQSLIKERKIFLADFWNSATASNGCICAGRPGGYYYVDWNGNISPCAFVPYSTDNIYKIYAEGGNINTPLESPLFKQIRAWQDRYGFALPTDKSRNWLCPCVIRDHFDVTKQAVVQSNAKPLNEEAAIALQDIDYCSGMSQYGKEIDDLTAPLWAREYAGEQEAAPTGRL